jgi:hypothetical protein
MGKPEFYLSGRVPAQGDTRRMLLVKRVQALQLTASSFTSNNNPTTADTRYRLLKKMDAIQTGKNGTIA